MNDFTDFDGFGTFLAVHVCVFHRIRAGHQKLPNAGRVGRGLSVAGGVVAIRRSVRAQAVEFVPEAQRFGQGETASR